MDELALIFLVVGLALVFIIFLVIGLIIYTLQRVRRRRVHVENIGITNKSFDSKYTNSDSNGRSPNLALTQHFHHEFGMPKKTFEAPSAPLTPPSSSSSSTDGITDFSTTKTLEAQTNGGSLRSVIIIDNEPEQKPDEQQESADTIVLPILVPIQNPQAIPQISPRERILPIDLPAAKAHRSFVLDATPHRSSQHMEKVQEHENERLYAEFDNLNQQIQMSSSNEGQTSVNIRKNRYYDIVCYDHNRVKLEDRPNDYINASYIRDEEGSIKYIAAQGPIGEKETIGDQRDATVVDFWHMIWQEEVDCIVMLCQCVEGHRQKSAHYWPQNLDETERIDNELTMNLYCYTEDEICFQREIWLEKKGEGRRKIIQWHYKEWNDAQSPKSNEDFLRFIETVRKSPKHEPIVVHCSAGVGRSGVYIGLDMLLNKLEAESIIDVQETVKNLRKARPNMVQNYDQYLTLYELIANAIRNKTNNN